MLYDVHEGNDMNISSNGLFMNCHGAFVGGARSGAKL